MMNNPGAAGESSCKRQENGDASTGSERPLKKARFAWQVKGKYHLKNEASDTKTSSATHSESDNATPAKHPENNTNDLIGNTEQNLEILGDYLLKQDFNTLDSVITDPDKSLLKPSTSISTEKLEYPRYIASYENNNVARASGSSSDEHMATVPMSMAVSHSYSEDQCIARWQARQMAKGFVDNTINRVLDSWMVAPLHPEMDNRFLALDVAEFINNLPGDNSIENEGILMAISAHGLQNTSSSSSNESHNEEQSSSSKDDAFPSPSNSPVHIEDIKDHNSNSKNDIGSNLSSFNNNSEWSYGEEERDEINDHSPFAFFPDTSSSSYLHYGENDHLQNSINELDRQVNGTLGGNDNFTSHYDFMDAAVSFAIQNKGLTSFGTDYG